MIINAASLAATRIGFQSQFQRSFEETTIEWERYVERISTTNDREVFYWLGGQPEMKRWVDDAQFEHIEAFTYELALAKWQAGIVMKREDIAYDRLGQVMGRIRRLAETAKRHPGVLAMEAIKTGDAALCYDGQYFFDTDHPSGSSTQANKITGALTAAKLLEMQQLFRRRKDHYGRHIQSRMTHLLIPTALLGVAKDILEAEYLSSGATNTMRGAVQLIEEPYLEYGSAGSAVKWYGLDLSGGAPPPLIYLEREGVHFDAQDNPTDEHVFMRQLYRYSTWYEGNIGYGHWQAMAMSTGV